MPIRKPIKKRRTTKAKATQADGPKTYMSSSFKKNAVRQRKPAKRRQPNPVVKALRSRKTKGGSKIKRQGFGKAKRVVARVATVLILMILPVTVAYLGFIGIKQVIAIRAAKTESINGVTVAKERVVGFKEIPIFPDSHFIYEGHLDNESVKKFLSNGESVYRLPPDVTFQDVAMYYEVVLPASGWDHIMSVPRTSTEMMFGEYWMREDGESALRIYNKLNDVWYQKISLEEAKSGLAEQVRLEHERDLIISTSDGNEFLPQFPWDMKVPTDYLIRYYDSNIDKVQAVELRRLGKDEKIYFEPLGQIGSAPPDVMMQQFIERVNSDASGRYAVEIEKGANQDNSDTQQDSKSKDDSQAAQIEWEIVSSVYKDIEGRRLLEVQIAAPGRGGTAYLFENYRTGNIFILTSFTTDNQMVLYMIKNLQDKKSGYTKEDFDF